MDTLNSPLPEDHIQRWLHSELWNKRIKFKIKLKIYKSLVIVVVIYDLEVSDVI